MLKNDPIFDLYEQVKSGKLEEGEYHANDNKDYTVAIVRVDEELRMAMDATGTKIATFENSWKFWAFRVFPSLKNLETRVEMANMLYGTADWMVGRLSSEPNEIEIQLMEKLEVGELVLVVTIPITSFDESLREEWEGILQSFIKNSSSPNTPTGNLH